MGAALMAAVPASAARPPTSSEAPVTALGWVIENVYAYTEAGHQQCLRDGRAWGGPGGYLCKVVISDQGQPLWGLFLWE